MTSSADNKRRKLDESGNLPDHELDDARIDDQERTDLAARRSVKNRNAQERITLEAYQEAQRALADKNVSAAERETAQKVMDAYETQGSDEQPNVTA